MEPIKPPVGSPRPVMDIRPHRPMQPISRSAVPIARPNFAVPTPPPTAVPAPSVEVAPVPIVSPVQPQPLAPAAPAVVEAPVETTMPAATAADPVLPPKVKAPILAIIVAVIVAVGLIALTVYAYTRTQKKSSKQTQDTSKAVMPAEVDASSKAIDDQLNTLKDSTDFNPADISDEKLGL